MEKFKNACFKGDGTETTADKIRKILQLLTGRQLLGVLCSTEYYYFINDYAINWSDVIPTGRKLFDIDKTLSELEKPKQENLFPKWMRVYNTETCAVNRFVLCKYDNLYISLPMIKNEEELKCYTRADLFGFGINLWEFAEDIDENEEKINKLNEKLQKAIKMIEHFTEQINNLKTK